MSAKPAFTYADLFAGIGGFHAVLDAMGGECVYSVEIDEAAQALGIHRHTVRARVAQAQQVLGLDLASFPARAELWAALVTTS